MSQNKLQSHGAHWTDEANENLLELFSGLADPDEIARDMGRTRGAVIGQLERLGKVVNDGGRVYKKTFWFDNRKLRHKSPGAREVKAYQMDVKDYLAAPMCYLDTHRVSNMLQVMVDVKAWGGKYIVTQWQDPSKDLSGHRRFTKTMDLIKRGIGANLAGWLAVSHQFQSDGGIVTQTGSPSFQGKNGEHALAKWLDVPIEISIALLHGQPAGYYDEVYPKPHDKATIDDVLTALDRLLETGNPGV